MQERLFVIFLLLIMLVVKSLRLYKSNFSNSIVSLSHKRYRSSSSLFSQPPIEPNFGIHYYSYHYSYYSYYSYPIINLGKDFEIKRDPIGKLELELINEHPIDNRITFDEKEHVYSFDGVQLKHSVTEFISKYFEKFDADIAIEKMKKSSRWPRAEYSFKVFIIIININIVINIITIVTSRVYH